MHPPVHIVFWSFTWVTTPWTTNNLLVLHVPELSHSTVFHNIYPLCYYYYQLKNCKPDTHTHTHTDRHTLLSPGVSTFFHYLNIAPKPSDFNAADESAYTPELESDFTLDKSIYNMIYNMIWLVRQHGAGMKRVHTASLAHPFVRVLHVDRRSPSPVVILHLLRCYTDEAPSHSCANTCKMCIWKHVMCVRLRGFFSTREEINLKPQRDMKLYKSTIIKSLWAALISDLIRYADD